MESYGLKLKDDSLSAALAIDEAVSAYNDGDYDRAIEYAEKSSELAKILPESDLSIKSLLILARSYRDIHLLGKTQLSFNKTLKYYLKSITELEATSNKLLLAQVFIEYGDFYLQLELPELTIDNYEKSLKFIDTGNKSNEKIIEKVARLHYDLGNIEQAIFYYDKLYSINKSVKNEQNEIRILIILSDLYREYNDYESAIFTAKELLAYSQRKFDVAGQIRYWSNIGNNSFDSHNHYQADKAYKNYFRLVKKDEDYLKEEIASLRYIKNLIAEGDIYTWSLDNGYWSDYETAIRYYSDAQKHADFDKYPELAAQILTRIGSIYFEMKDFKTSITFLDLAKYYGSKSNNLKLVSNNHLMLARVYTNISKWKEATNHYELHAAYKDSIMQIAENEKKIIATFSIIEKKENLKIAQTLDAIEKQERQELAFAEKEIRNVALERELELYRQDAALKEIMIRNQKLAEDSTIQNFMLTKEQLENERNAKMINKLNNNREKQDLLLKNKEAERQNSKQKIKILEQVNSLSKSRQAYYLLFIVLIGSSLIFIIVVYFQKRKTNFSLKKQNEKIKLQSEKLKQAYQNLELLSTIGRDITSSLIIEEIIETVYENLNRLMDASVFGIGVFDNSKNQLHFPKPREKNHQLKDICFKLSTTDSLAAFCFNNQKEIIIDNYFLSFQDFIQPVELPVPGDGNASSIIYLPLTIGVKKLGVLTVQSFNEKAFDDYQINIIRNIAIYTKIALENANVYRTLEIQSLSLQKANKNIGEQNKLIEEQFQQLLSINKEKNNLINILAHDLRNPLAIAMSMTELVRFEKSNLSKEQLQASEIIWRGLNRMNDMIRKILDIKAIESQNVNLDFEIIDANDLTAPLEKIFINEAENKEIKLHFSHEGEESLINVDQSFLMQVMENIISNAIKFSPVQRNVYMHIYEKNECIRISIRDEGQGIPKVECADLFKKYQKLSPKPTAGEQSIGLGLSIVKKYVEAMNGRVWCVSEEGRGSEFIVEFNKESVVV